MKDLPRMHLDYFRIFFSLLLWTVAQSFTNGQNINATASLDTNAIYIGDQVKLSLLAEYKKDVIVTWPLLPDTLGKLEVVKRSKVDTLASALNTIHLKQDFYITSFDSGRYQIPAFKFLYNLANDTSKKETYTEPLQITVKSIVVDTTKEIKDIKPPLEIPFSLIEFLKENYYFILGGAALVGVVIALILYLLKRKKKTVEKVKQAPQKPPHLIAIEQLELIEKEKLWQQGDFKSYYSRISDVVRIYIGQRFNINAMELTTNETLSMLRNVPENDKMKLRQVLHLADLVKFAKIQPLASENEMILQLSYQFIHSTKPSEPDSNKEDLLKS